SRRSAATRRSERATALARDIQRSLADEVVEARPPSAGYRLKKFVRRHKVAVVAGSLVVLALVLGLLGTSLGLAEAQKQRQLAEAQRDEKEQARAAEAEQRRAADQAYQIARESL